MNTIKGALNAMGQRIENARKSFVDNLIEQFALTTEQAHHVLDVYIKLKVVKLDPIGGVYNLKHGIYWEPDVIRNAVEYTI